MKIKKWLFRKIVFPIFKEYCKVEINVKGNKFYNKRVYDEPNTITILVDVGVKGTSFSYNDIHNVFEDNIIGKDIIFINTDILKELKKIELSKPRTVIKNIKNNIPSL